MNTITNALGDFAKAALLNAETVGLDRMSPSLDLIENRTFHQVATLGYNGPQTPGLGA